MIKPLRDRDRKKRESKNIKGLVVCETGSDYCEVAERGCYSKKQDQTTVEGRGAKKKLKFLEANLDSF